MNAERQFKLWQDGFDDGYLSFEDFEQIFALGRKSGIDSVNSLPHRAMFDAGVEQGIEEGRIIGFAEGRKSGLEDAAETAMQKDCPHDLGCGQSVAAAFRQRIEETE